VTRREIGLAVLALGALGAWIYYENRQTAAAAQAALTATNGGGSANDANAAATGDLSDGAGSFG